MNELKQTSFEQMGEFEEVNAIIIFLLYQNVFLVKMGKKWVFWIGFYFHAQIKFKLLDTHLEAIIKMVNNCQTDKVIEKITRRIGKVSVMLQ